MNNKVITYLSVTMIFIAAYCLFSIKSEVQEISYRLSETTKQINEERNSLSILKAEFAVLQSPKRLRALADKYLELTSIKSDQMTESPLFAPEHQYIAMTQPKLTPTKTVLKHNVAWRYKNQSYRNNNRSNIKTVSHKRQGR